MVNKHTKFFIIFSNSENANQKCMRYYINSKMNISVRQQQCYKEGKIRMFYTSGVN